MASVARLNVICTLFFMLITTSYALDKDEVDKVIEDEITQKLSEDLLQSIEKKFHVDLERSVDSVLMKIKMLLQNGTTHIQERLAELQAVVEAMKKDNEANVVMMMMRMARIRNATIQIQDRLTELQEAMDQMKMDNEPNVEACLLEHQNDTTTLAEKALHQMVVCGYALIGHDPAQAVRSVMELKSMIKHGLKPIYDQRQEVYNLLKVCGHDHDSLKKVIKCVISKSPQLKSAMMGVSGKLIDGVVHLTKQMAHGAMHEACLIEVIKTVEEEAFLVLGKVKKCVYKNDSRVQEEVDKYIRENNATVLDINQRAKDLKDEKAKDELLDHTEKDIVEVTMDKVDNVDKKEIKKETKEVKKEIKDGSEMKTILRRMLKESKNQEGLDKKFKENILKIQKELGGESNALGGDGVKAKD